MMEVAAAEAVCGIPRDIVTAIAVPLKVMFVMVT
jgi:hypothetical protein